MATFAVAQSPSSPSISGSPTSPDLRSKEVPPPLSLTVDSPAASSPFPSPSSSFVPPPMPGAHEYANKHPSGRLIWRKKSSSPSGANEEPDASAVLKKDGTQSNEALREPNGIGPTVDTYIGSVNPVATMAPCTPTPASIAVTPTAKAPHNIDTPPFNITEACSSDADLTSTVSPPPAAESSTTFGRNTPTQMHITLPPPPSSPSQIFSNAPTLMRTPSSSGVASKHTSLSSSRPAPASPSPIASRRQSGVPSVRSRHRSGLSTASTSSSKFGTIKSPPPLPQTPKRKGEIKIRDFAFPSEDVRHKGRGPEAPKVIKKLLKHHGPLDAGSRRESGMSESSLDSEASSRRSSGFGNWGAFRWASKLSGAWRFGGATGSGSGSRTSGAGGYTPSQQDFERNFDDTADVDLTDSAADDDEYSSDYEDDVDAEPEELLPGLYRALYDFDPEGTAEMGLKEGQIVKVVGRGGGVGWAIAVRADAEAEGGEANWALVPESYLRIVKLDEPDTEEEGEQSLDDVDLKTERD